MYNYSVLFAAPKHDKKDRKLNIKIKNPKRGNRKERRNNKKRDRSNSNPDRRKGKYALYIVMFYMPLLHNTFSCIKLMAHYPMTLLCD